MKIAIIGGGNLGAAMACYIPKEHDVYIHSSKPDIWSNEITYIDKVSGAQSISTIKCVTDSYKLAVEDADVVFITHPSFMVEDTLKDIAPYVKSGAMVGVVPGSGGAEFFCKEVLEKGAIFFGMDRVPCVSRIVEYGKSVTSSKKAKTRLAAIPRAATEEVSRTMADILDMEIEPLANYLVVTFTPSNPLMHTSRLYAMLKDYEEGMTWERNIPFYAEWDDASSEMLIGCDNELQEICRALAELDMSGVIPLTEHYESGTVRAMTDKIRSIETMKHILSPMIEKDGRFVIDKESRYFKEDLPFGLCTIKGFAIMCDIDTPHIDTILKWYEKFGNVEYFVQDKFEGKDLASAAIPQNYELENVDEVYNFYL